MLDAKETTKVLKISESTYFSEKSTGFGVRGPGFQISYSKDYLLSFSTNHFSESKFPHVYTEEVA